MGWSCYKSHPSLSRRSFYRTKHLYGPSLRPYATPEDNNIGSLFETMKSSSDLRNAFFAVLRQAVKAATGNFLAPTPAVDMLDAQQDTFMNECELSMRGALVDRAQGYIHA
jgi:hypothetical protein